MIDTKHMPPEKIYILYGFGGITRVSAEKITVPTASTIVNTNQIAYIRADIAKGLLEALKNLIDQAQEDMPIDSRTAHFETAMDDAFAAIGQSGGLVI